MQDQPINFYLNKQSVEIVDKLESINRKFKKMLSELKRSEIIIKKNKKEEKFERIRIDARLRE